MTAGMSPYQDNDGENSKNELDELRAKLRETRKSLETKEADLAAMKTQAESTNREYDRLSEEHQKLQVARVLFEVIGQAVVNQLANPSFKRSLESVGMQLGVNP